MLLEWNLTNYMGLIKIKEEPNSSANIVVNFNIRKKIVLIYRKYNQNQPVQSSC